MAYYIRKISRPKWPKDLSNISEATISEVVQNVSADAITNCIKTKDKKLSLWKVDKKNPSIDDIIPLIIGFDRPDTCDIVYIEESMLEKEGIKIEQSIEDADILIEELKPFHYNAFVKDYRELGQFAKLILLSLSDSYVRFTTAEVKRKLKDMLNSGEITEEVIPNVLVKKLLNK